MKNTSRISNKKDALTVALHSGAAYDYAIAKSRRQFKRPKSEKTPYERGGLGPSVISTAIKEHYGWVMPRLLRKKLAKATSQPMTKFYARG